MSELTSIQANAEQRRIEDDVKLIEKQKAREKFVQDYPHLEPGKGSKVGAKNIRRQLKATFPGIKFSTTSDSISINISWQDGPTREQVMDIAEPYKAGTFFGVCDTYWYNDDRTWPFGDAKYISCVRSAHP